MSKERRGKQILILMAIGTSYILSPRADNGIVEEEYKQTPTHPENTHNLSLDHDPIQTHPPTPTAPRPLSKIDTSPTQTTASSTPVVIKPSPTSNVKHVPPRVENIQALETSESLISFFQPNPNLNIGMMNLVDSDKKDLETWRDLIEWLARYYEWDANLAAAQMKMESDFINGQISEKGAVGLWGIMPGINGAPDAEVLMDPFWNGTWHFAKVVDVCRVQGDTLTNSLARYFAGEENIEAGMDDAIRVLQIAGYANESGNLLIPNRCESLNEVPEAPDKISFLNR